MKVVQQCKIVEIIDDCAHSSYSKISCDPLKSLDRLKMRAWMKKKMLERMKFPKMQHGDQSDSDASDDQSDSDAFDDRSDPDTSDDQSDSDTSDDQ